MTDMYSRAILRTCAGNTGRAPPRFVGWGGIGKLNVAHDPGYYLTSRSVLEFGHAARDAYDPIFRYTDG